MNNPIEKFLNNIENNDDGDIYKAIEFVEKSLSGLLEPERKEQIQGTAEILKIFNQLSEITFWHHHLMIILYSKPLTL